MKSILHIRLPKWARWVAIDKHGVLMCFEGKPEPYERSWICDGRKKDILSFCNQEYRGWKKSLRKARPGFAFINSQSKAHL